MRIVCLNGWGGTMYGALIPWLERLQPGILCLQEVVHTPGARKDWLTYRDGTHVLPQRARFLDDVRAALPDHWAHFSPAAQGDLWDGDASVPSQWGLATFVHRSLTIIGQVQGFVHRDYSPDGYGDHPRSRMAHGVRVHDPRRKRPVCVLHMHGLRDLAGKHDTSERRAQAQRLAGFAQALAQPGDDLVVCGDFNVGPDSETLEILCALGLRELVTGYGFPGTRTSRYEKPGRFADYMLVNMVEQAFEVICAPEVSDHCPLLLTL